MLATHLGTAPQARAAAGAALRQSRGWVALVHAGNGNERWCRSLRATLQGQRLTALPCVLPQAEGVSVQACDDCAVRRVLDAVVRMQLRQPMSRGHTGLFAVGPAATAVLRAAALAPALIDAVVTWDARFEAVAAWLPQVRAATLFIVDSGDFALLPAHSRAMRALGCVRRLELLSGCDEQAADIGTIETAAQLATAWFSQHLPGPRAALNA